MPPKKAGSKSWLEKNVKVVNLCKFFVKFFALIGTIAVISIYFLDERDPLKLLGIAIITILVWRILLSIYRRLIIPAKHPLTYGKWAIVTGSTSGIGKEFAQHFASLGMSVMLISRTERKLKEQCKQLKDTFKVDCDYLVYDFTVTQDGNDKKEFYEALDAKCAIMNDDGGVGVLVNNVGTANEIPKRIEEFTDQDVSDLVNCNIYSLLWMTRTVLKHMRSRSNGAIISISSGSGNNPSPFLALYSATKAFMTQFTRSLHIEHWGSGVDFLVVTPFYIGGTNLYKAPQGTILAPLPSVLVKGTLAQLGKTYIWQGHGYWFHGMLNNFANYYWGTTAEWRAMMIRNRERHDAKVEEKRLAAMATDEEDKKKA